jgi:hypothetical protein
MMGRVVREHCSYGRRGDGARRGVVVRAGMCAVRRRRGWRRQLAVLAHPSHRPATAHRAAGSPAPPPATPLHRAHSSRARHATSACSPPPEDQRHARPRPSACSTQACCAPPPCAERRGRGVPGGGAGEPAARWVVAGWRLGCARTVSQRLHPAARALAAPRTTTTRRPACGRACRGLQRTGRWNSKGRSRS